MSFGLILTSSSMNAASRKSVFLMTIFKGQRQIQIFGMMKNINNFKLDKNANDKFAENVVLYSWWKKH